MAFSDFTITDLQVKLGIRATEVEDMHAAVAEVSPRAPLAELLAGTFFPLATLMGTEKAKSELMIAPLLVEVRELLHRRVSFFSGAEFNVDRERGLNGACDFLMSRSPFQSVIQSPVAVVVEVKNDNILAGYGQCGAEMVAARIFNEKAKNGIDLIHGCVSTGSSWRFMTLRGDDLTIDRTLYQLPEHLKKLLGILVHAVGGPLP